MRLNTDNGLSSKVKNKINGKEYLISTAKYPSGVWETAVFGKNFLGMVRIRKPVRVKTTLTFEDAEKEHSWCEIAVESLPKTEWENTLDKKFFYISS